MAMTDLAPAADNLCALIAAVPDSDLGRPTPYAAACPLAPTQPPLTLM
jgi:hypothetical protein